MKVLKIFKIDKSSLTRQTCKILNEMIVKSICCYIPQLRALVRDKYVICDAPNSGGPLTTRQPVEYSCMSGDPIFFTKIGQSLLCTGSST